MLTGICTDITRPKDKKYSPVDGDFRGLCPLYFGVGASELLLDDALVAGEWTLSQGS